MDTINCNDVSQQEFKWLSVECIVIGSCYLLLLIPIGRNVYYYCFKQQRYKVYLISIFYFTAIIVATFRALMFADYAIENVGNQYFYFGNIASLIASFASFTL